MGLKVNFSDNKNTSFYYLLSTEIEEYFNGASRRTLTLEIARDSVNIEDLDALCSVEQNVARIELVNETEGITNIHEGYVLKLKVGVEPKLVDAEANTYEDRVFLKLGKRTYIEEKLHALGL